MRGKDIPLREEMRTDGSLISRVKTNLWCDSPSRGVWHILFFRFVAQALESFVKKLIVRKIK